MTLLITVFAAVVSTLVWYNSDPGSSMKTHILCFMFWGASLMWLVDAIFEYAELGAEYFAPKASDMLGDAFLGLSAVALGLIIWLVIVLVTDPKNRIKNALKSR